MRHYCREQSEFPGVSVESKSLIFHRARWIADERAELG